MRLHVPDILTGSDDGVIGRMWIEVTLGVPKSESSVVRTAEDSAMWDGMVIEWRDVKARGLMPVLDIDWPGPADPVWWSDPDPAEAGETAGDGMRTNIEDRFALSDDGPIGRMWVDVTNGVPKADSVVVRTAEDSAQWDELAAEWQALKGTGVIAALSLDWPGSGEPIWHGSEPAPPDDPDPVEPPD